MDGVDTRYEYAPLASLSAIIYEELPDIDYLRLSLRS